MLLLVIIITIKQSCHTLSNWECQTQKCVLLNLCHHKLTSTVVGNQGRIGYNSTFPSCSFFPLRLRCLTVKPFHHNRQEACAWWHRRCVARVLTKCLFINLISTYDHRLVMQELEAGAWTLEHHSTATVNVSLGLIHLHLLTVKTHLSFIPVVTSWPYYSLSWIKKWK